MSCIDAPGVGYPSDRQRDDQTMRGVPVLLTGGVVVALLSPRASSATQDDELVERPQVDDRTTTRRRFLARTATDDSVATPDTVPVTGPRPRASMLATFALVLGVVAAVAVLTGLLAGPGVAVGLLAVVFGIGGIAATGRRHVAGKGDALLGVSLGLG